MALNSWRDNGPQTRVYSTDTIFSTQFDKAFTNNGSDLYDLSNRQHTSLMYIGIR